MPRPVAEPAERAAAVGGIGHDMNLAAGEVFGEQIDQLPRQVRFRRATLDRQGGQHRQRHRPGQKRQRDHDGHDHPVVAEPEFDLPGGRTVMKPARGVDLATPAAKQRVIHRHRDHRTRDQQMTHDHLGQQQSHLPGAPARG